MNDCYCLRFRCRVLSCTFWRSAAMSIFLRLSCLFASGVEIFCRVPRSNDRSLCVTWQETEDEAAGERHIFFWGGGGFRCHLSREREYPRRAASLAGSSGGIPGICSGLVSVGAVKSALFRVSTKAPVERRRACVAFHDRNVAKKPDRRTDRRTGATHDSSFWKWITAVIRHSLPGPPPRIYSHGTDPLGHQPRAGLLACTRANGEIYRGHFVYHP